MDEKAKAIRAAKADEANRGQHEVEAARVIQRNYRGYRTRRELHGMRLDASTRWMEALREIQFRNATRPRSPDHRLSVSSDASTVARKNWKRVAEIVRRAGHDDPSDSDSDDKEGMTPEQLEQWHQKRKEARLEREKIAKAMDLQYFLEMVDPKHRYGANLRAYHSEWKKADTHENFFYWLDYGGGRNLELPTISRAQLEAEQVRYLSREERLNYLVEVDGEGRLCWARNGERITTSTDYKDSVDGIVPIDDPTPPYKRPEPSPPRTSTETSGSSILSASADDLSPKHYVNHEYDKAKGLAKLKHITPSVIMDHLLRKSVRPNSWIFVADTSSRLYVGIKQSGAFQHSSFLNGARITAAGLIEIADGKLRRLSPLSGHYRPPTRNFRQFERALRAAGVDMSHVSISRSYAILLGLEAYERARKKIRRGARRVAHPAEFKKGKRERSKSAEKEREVLGDGPAAEREHQTQMELPVRARDKIVGVPFVPDGADDDPGLAHAPATVVTRESSGSGAEADAESVAPLENKE